MGGTRRRPKRATGGTTRSGLKGVTKGRSLPSVVGNRAFTRLATGKGGTSRPRLPFGHRYAATGPAVMSTVTSGGGGLVQYPATGAPESSAATTPQISVVSGSAFGDMPTGEARAVTQSAVMGNVSPNAAAAALGLPCPDPRAWEWLHLVAFSIRETHVDGLSLQSRELIRRSGQPQQIRENLVLGTAAANTAMLSWETAVKDVMRRRPDWTIDLFVAASKEDRPVPGPRGTTVTIPVATRIEYHFMFRTGDGRVIPPVVLAFDPMSHVKPPRSEFEDVVTALEAHLAHATPADVQGMRTSGLDAV